MKLNEGTPFHVGKTPSDQYEGGTEFTSAAPEYEYAMESPIDNTFRVSDTPQMSLDKFFERPIKIFQFEWAPSTVMNEEFNPWQLFFTQKKVINRIANYKLARCKLHVKFTINGNGWYYGMAIAAYNPYIQGDAFTVSRPLIPEDMVQLSQKPHIFINPTNNAGGTLKLPFFYPQNYMHTVYENWDNLGKIYMRSFQDLSHANGVVNPVTITVFAWAEDMELAVPTSVNPGAIAPQSGLLPPPMFDRRLVIQSIRREFNWLYSRQERYMILDELFGDPYFEVEYMSYREAIMLRDYIHRTRVNRSPIYRTQSGEKKKDEYGTGVVSRPASVLAAAAGKLTNIPTIGPYARATQMAASAVSSIATAFGYSKPTNVAPVNRYRMNAAGDLATTAGTDNAMKLAIDPKNEVTIDSRTVGLDGTDEMDLTSIATRETFLEVLDWPVASTNGLWQCQVTPMLWRSVPIFGTPLYELHFPACAFAAIPFLYWRGSMRYRFQVVASNYHKGRLRVVWDPVGYTSGDEPDYNTNFNYVIDIEDTKDFTVEIGWASTQPYLTVDAVGGTPEAIQPNSQPFVDTTNAQISHRGANGLLRVHVVNELTVPSDTSPQAYINVFVSAGDDIEFAVPTNRIDTYSYFSTQSGEVEKIPEQPVQPQEPVLTEPPKGDFVVGTSAQEIELVYFKPQSGQSEKVPGDGDVTDSPNEPEPQMPDNTMGAHLSPTDHTPEVFIGERVKSIRTLLKRYCRHSAFNANVQNPGALVYSCPDFPWHKGYAPGGRYTVLGSTKGYNYGHMTYLNYFAPAFAGWRGAIRWKWILKNGQGTTSYAGSFEALRRSTDSNFGIVVIPKSNAGSQTATQLAWEAYNKGSATSSGSAITTLSTTDCLEFELPYYSNRRFLNARQADHTTIEEKAHQVIHRMNMNLSWDNYVDRYVAAGEDFSLFFFVGCPIMIANIPIPTSDV